MSETYPPAPDGNQGPLEALAREIEECSTAPCDEAALPPTPDIEAAPRVRRLLVIMRNSNGTHVGLRPYQ